jgi:hypothetical protein
MLLPRADAALFESLGEEQRNCPMGVLLLLQEISHGGKGSAAEEVAWGKRGDSAQVGEGTTDFVNVKKNWGRRQGTGDDDDDEMIAVSFVFCDEWRRYCKK